jgi:hypothetical protein
MRKSRFILMLAVMVLLVLCISPGIGSADPPKDIFYVTAKTSTGGNSPGQQGSGDSAIWEYAYDACTGSSFTDNLVVEFSIENGNSTTGQCYIIGFTQSGNPGVDATFPASFSLCDDNVVASKQIVITGSSLTQGTKQLNIDFSEAGQGSPPPQVTEHKPKKIQVTVVVADCDSAPPPICFFTSSDFVFLYNCQGELVSDQSGGTYILNNKKNNGIIVATNPGQFYYNYIWENPGDAVDVKVCLDDLENLDPHGANAVHAKTFNTTGFTQDLDAFDMVNQDGTPCGPSGPCTINVGQGETLWVTWHLEYSHVGGSPSTPPGNSCPGSEHIGASAFLLESTGICGGQDQTVIAGECKTDATGYNMR